MGSCPWRIAGPTMWNQKLAGINEREKAFLKALKRTSVCKSTFFWDPQNSSSLLWFNQKPKLAWLLSRGRILSGKIIFRSNQNSPHPTVHKHQTLSGVLETW